jgi:Fuc2NAc and GlcNAc transferase
MFFNIILILFFALFICIILTKFYRSFAIKNSIKAIPNNRTLHFKSVPSGGGVVFSSLFVSIIVLLEILQIISLDILMVIGIGGLIAILFGLTDDIFDISAPIKFFIQSILAAWSIFWLDGGALVEVAWIPLWISWLVSWFMLVWMINLYNFIDGVDGMAASGAVFIPLTLIVVLLIKGESSDLVVLLSVLGISSLGFLIYNWPPASIFMGDSGSVFLGYVFGTLIIKTTMTGEVSIWSWIIVFAYFVSDTVVTQILRIILVKKWWHAHRSHAYQNLARITESHLKVTGGVTIYNLFWIFPLTIWSSLVPELSLIAVLLAVIPAIVVACKYGPIFSSS